ncbi:MAG: hypothetical protein RR775_01285 [Massilia sp.]|uniref:hypothetical protein n=1 Tax=Massilia sp. TaxID=1882437 RepID=UPI002FC97BF8
MGKDIPPATEANPGDNTGLIERGFCFSEVKLRQTPLLQEIRLNYPAKATTLL